jgi:hypothetical protein
MENEEKVQLLLEEYRALSTSAERYSSISSSSAIPIILTIGGALLVYKPDETSKFTGLAVAAGMTLLFLWAACGHAFLKRILERLAALEEQINILAGFKDKQGLRYNSELVGQVLQRYSDYRVYLSLIAALLLGGVIIASGQSVFRACGKEKIWAALGGISCLGMIIVTGHTMLCAELGSGYLKQFWKPDPISRDEPSAGAVPGSGHERPAEAVEDQRDS